MSENTKKDIQKIDWDKPYIVSDPYNLPVHDQGNINNCTSHAFASLTEQMLSNHFKERTLVDVDDLWDKQKKFGTATEDGDRLDGPIFIAVKYGVRFKTDSGILGTLYVTKQEKNKNWDKLTELTGSIILDK